MLARLMNTSKMGASGSKKIAIWLLVLFSISVQALRAASCPAMPVPTDSVSRNAGYPELHQIYRKQRATSTYPVTISRKGTSLLVESGYNQVLPVYKGNGVFYGLFRLNKGTNWISGLPRGVYLINNHRFVLS